MDYTDICPPEVALVIREADLRSSEAANLVTWVEEKADRRCALAALESMAERVSPETDLTVFDLFCNAVASYARMLDADQKVKVRNAYRRFPYVAAISFNYFLGLRKAGIDVRVDLIGKIRQDWSFASPRRDAETWDYFLYLASLDEPGALEALSDKIAETSDGNDATLLLMSLADLPGAKVDAVLALYAQDTRRADGVEGPGLPIAENIRLMRLMRAEMGL